MVEKVLNVYNALVGGVVMLLSGILGEYWYLFAAFLALNMLDWFSGWAKSRVLHKESSQAGLQGIVKKTGYWAVIAAAFLIAHALTRLSSDMMGVRLEFLQMLGWFTLASFLVNEARSICENFVAMGYPVPVFLAKGLQITQELLEQQAEPSHDMGKN